MKKIHSLPHLLAFDAAARNESFSVAARELCLTTGAISRHIRSLETKLGAELFSRSHKEVKLTERGRVFAMTCRRVLDELSAAENVFSDKVNYHRITVNCLPTFAMHWLIPRLIDFHRVFPHIHVSVITRTGLVETGTDIAIRRDPSHFPGMDAFAFLKEKSALVSSPHFLLNHEEQSAANALIHIRVREDLWRQWSTEGLTLPKHITRHLYLDHTFAAMQAAEDGLGVALVPLLFCEKQLSSGRLVQLEDYGTLYSGNYSMVLQEKETPAIREFITWLREWEDSEKNGVGKTG